MFLLSASFTVKAQNNLVTLKVKNASLQKVFASIEKQTTYRFSYLDAQVDNKRDITMDVTQVPVSDVLNKCLPGHNLQYEILSEKSIVIKKVQSAKPKQNATMKTVKGRILDANGEPVIGATILEHGTRNGVAADIDGYFTITVPVNSTLDVSALGYETKVTDVKDNMSIVLTNDDMDLDEIVVTALGMTHSQKSLGYATQKFDGDKLTTVKGANIASSLTGQVSGLRIYNSTEFDKESTLRLRGESPLIVVDGIPTEQSLNDFNQDVIESITVLKGATASALYGSRGGNGAVMITTKKAGKKGFEVEVNSSDMFFAGYTRIPEAQTSYGTGSGSKWGDLYYVWGPKLDVGEVVNRWNPLTKQMEDMPLVSSGKNNFKNFLEFSLVSNNSVSVASKGEHGSIHSTLSYMHNKNPYPNTNQNKFWYNVGAELKLNDKASIETSLNYVHSMAPQTAGYGYGSGYIYDILVWSGPDYDLRDYRDYWLVKNEKQNYFVGDWYDNPYYQAFEKVVSKETNTVNGSLSFKYSITDWLKVQLRAGGVFGSNVNIHRNAMDTHNLGRLGNWNHKNGSYKEATSKYMKMNYDALLLANKRFGDFSIDGILGGSMYYYRQSDLSAATQGGLTIPAYYSLYASKDALKVESGKYGKNVNSLFATATFGYKDTYFIEASGRNDWSSTLPTNENSYFYPAVNASVIGSNILNMPEWMPFWKLRASWAISKRDLGIYATSQDYSVSNNVWDGLSSATLPSSIRGLVKPITDRTWEIGASMYFLKDARIKLDVAYYNKLTYNNTRSQAISPSAGYTSVLMNINEKYVRRGFEATVFANVIKNKKFQWDATLNLSKSHRYYAELDEEYSDKSPWVGKGKRWDWFARKSFMKDSEGNYIHGANGRPIKDDYKRLMGYTDPDLELGLANTFRFGNFQVGMNFDGRINGVTWNITESYMYQSGSHPDLDNQWRYDEVVNGKKNYIGPGVKLVSGEVKFDTYGNITEDTRVFAPNDIETSYEGYWRYAWDYYDDLFLQNKTFLKLRELSIGYNFPASMFKSLGLGINNAYLGLVGQNLFVLTKDFRFADPDGFEGAEGMDGESLSSPSVRYIGVNLKVTF